MRKPPSLKMYLVVCRLYSFYHKKRLNSMKNGAISEREGNFLAGEKFSERERGAWRWEALLF
jgi:hypothetical protein